MNIGDNNGGAVAGSFSLSAQLPNGKSLTFSGYVLQAESESDVHMKIDLAVRAVERQRLIAEVPELEARLEQMLDAKAQMEAILQTTSQLAKLSSQEKSNVNTAKVNLGKLERDIARGTAAIQKARDAAAKVF